MKRHLTTEEIENILTESIPLNRGIPRDVAISSRNNVIKTIRNDLEKILIYPEILPQLKYEIERQYYKTQIQPGESVGILTAQSIGERQTQSTLNTFHSTGISMKTVIAGVPRFSELLNATTSPKAQSCTIYFTEKFNTITELREKVNHSLTDFNLSLLSSRDSEIFLDGKTRRIEDEWYQSYELLYGEDHLEYTCFIRFYLKGDVLYQHFLDLETICENLENEFEDLKCVFSPNDKSIIDVWIDLSEIGHTIEYLTEEECLLTYLEDTAIPELTKISVCGISGISNIFPEKRGGEWILETEGSNLQKILSLDFVDKCRTISNNMWEIYEVLGIEAARNFLIEEFNGVVSSDGTYVNDSHIMLLVDIMTYSGKITSVNRYGLKKENCGPFAKASFEESLENFTKAGIFGEVEEIKGVSASVVLGKNAKIGTGLCDILIDINKLPPVLNSDLIQEKSNEIIPVELPKEITSHLKTFPPPEKNQNVLEVKEVKKECNDDIDKLKKTKQTKKKKEDENLITTISSKIKSEKLTKKSKKKTEN